MKKIYLYIAVVALALFVVLLIKNNISLKSSVKNRDTIIENIEQDNATLIFEKGQLGKYINQLNTDFKVKIDSLAKANDIKVKNIVAVYETKIKYLNEELVKMQTSKPEVTVPEKDSVKVNRPDSLGINLPDTLPTYKIGFENKTQCHTIEGYMVTKDPESEAYLSKVGFEVEVVRIKYKAKPKWFQFWKWFCRRKVEAVIIGDCGEVQVKEFIEE